MWFSTQDSIIAQGPADRQHTRHPDSYYATAVKTKLGDHNRDKNFAKGEVHIVFSHQPRPQLPPS